MTQLIDTYTTEKYMPIDDFRPHVPKPDLKGCLIWFIVFVIVVTLIIGISVIFELK